MNYANYRPVPPGMITVARAAALLPLPGRRKPHAAVVCRWMFQGITVADGRVVRVEHARVEGRLLTTVEAVHRFLRGLCPVKRAGG